MPARTSPLATARRAWRRTGADLPFGDPLPSHRRSMEGWYWRATDAATGRVVVALCGVNRHPDGDWATVAVATEPGGHVVSAVVPDARAAEDRFALDVGDGVLRADDDGVEVHLDGADVSLRMVEPAPFPRSLLHGGGLASVVPYLGQYWHPHVLGGTSEVVAEVRGERWHLPAAGTYAERNWGTGFPQHWWWGQVHDLVGRDGEVADACVAFGGGRLTLGRLGVDVTGAVVRVGGDVVRFAPPLGLLRATFRHGRWSLRGRTPGWSLELEADASHLVPHVLPVPRPEERRNVDTDLEVLAGPCSVVVRRRGRVVLDATSEMATLEVGAQTPDEVRALWDVGGLAAPT